MMTPSIKLSYFNLEAAGEPVRLALALSKTPFEDIRVGWDEWPALKPTLPNGQLPVMTIDDGPMRTQSKAMVRWVGATFSETLYPRENIFDIEETFGLVEDLQSALQPCIYMGMNPSKYGYPADYKETDECQQKVKEMRQTFMAETFPSFMTRLSDKITAHGGKFLVAGDEPTIVDCLAIPVLRGFTRGYMDHIEANCMDGYPVMVEYIKNFCALEQIKGRYSDGLH